MLSDFDFACHITAYPLEKDATNNMSPFNYPGELEARSVNQDYFEYFL